MFKNTATNQIFVMTDAACNLTLLDNMNAVDLIDKAIQYATEFYCKCAWSDQNMYTSLISAGGENNRATNEDFYDWWLRNKGRDSITANWTRRDGISVLGANGITACFDRLSNQGRRR